MAKKKTSSKAAQTTVVEPPPPPGAGDSAGESGGDEKVNPADLIVGGTEESKTLGELAAEDVDASSLLAFAGVDESIDTMINDAVSQAQSLDNNVANVLDGSMDDITRAKSTESMQCYDAVRASVLANAEILNRVGKGDIQGALDVFEKKNRIRGGVFEAIGKRKRLEMDDVTSHRRHIIQQTINQVVEDLEKALSEEGVEPEKVSAILQRLGDKVAVRFGDDSADE